MKINFEKYLQKQNNIFRSDYHHRIKTAMIYFGSDHHSHSLTYLFAFIMIVDKVTAHSKNKNQRKMKDKTKDELHIKWTFPVWITNILPSHPMNSIKICIKKQEKRMKRCSVAALWQQNLLNLYKNILIHIWNVPLNNLGEQQHNKQY